MYTASIFSTMYALYYTQERRDYTRENIISSVRRTWRTKHSRIALRQPKNGGGGDGMVAVGDHDHDGRWWWWWRWRRSVLVPLGMHTKFIVMYLLSPCLLAAFLYIKMITKAKGIPASHPLFLFDTQKNIFLSKKQT